ncbi:MAG: hypothetical protein MJZ38_03060 [archaeon]|nr:hypothetical protein [archaeon]
MAIIVYCCYGAFVSAVPSNVSDLGEVFQVEDMNMNTSSSDGLTFDLDFQGKVKSGLPQDVEGVCLQIAIGEKDTRMVLADISNLTIKANATTDIVFHKSIPVFALMSYAALGEVSDDGKLNIPMCTTVAFKYLKWQGEYLIDMGFTIRSDMPVDVPGGEIKVHKEAANNLVKTDIVVDKGVLDDFATGMNSSGVDNMVLTCGDAEFGIDLQKVGDKMGISISASGTSDKTAADIMQEYMDANGGKLTLTYGGNDYTLDEDNSATFIDILNAMYGKEANA